MLRTAMRLDHPARRDLRWLAEDFVYYLPFAGTWLTRAGGVRACPENAERLLGRGSVVAAFPEGIKGIAKPYRERYRLRRFGRGGFVRLALRTETPILPCAILGAEETGPLLGRVEFGARALGLPYFPITPTFPWLGPLGLIPAPTKWRLAFGEPLEFSAYGPEAAGDDVLVGRLTERVRAGVQRMLDEARALRKSVFFG
jgi:1-acyl-sn-glycerol-3-phosphate acyltransferase